MPSILALPLPSLPEIKPGDDLAALIADAWRELSFQDALLAPRGGDVLVVTQKVVSKAEGCLIDLRTIEPRPEAVEFARMWDRDARQVEVVLRESAEIVRMEHGVVVSRTKHGFVCANAGVDASNTGRGDWVTLLPDDPDASARNIRAGLASNLNLVAEQTPAIIVSDSFGRPWRFGIMDVALGVAGIEPLTDLRGIPDADGRIMHSTIVAVADEICSAAELASGKATRQPVVLVRGAEFNYRAESEPSVVREVVMPPEMDLFK
jgi:coenzyme F420-0:L-glutamate ligase/coenzyme F420-1:gamma-L-glutamate ligase